MNIPFQSLLVTVLILSQESQAFKVENQSDPDVLLKKAKELLATANIEFGKSMYQSMMANWKYITNLTDENLAEQIKVSNKVSKCMKKLQKQVKAFPWKKLQDEDAKRQFFFFSSIGKSLPKKLSVEYKNITNQMFESYSFKSSKQKNAFFRRFFPRYVELSNIAARLNKYNDKSALWLSNYEAEDFEQQIESLWQELKPFYLQIHAYVRRELRKSKAVSISKDGPIPCYEADISRWQIKAHRFLPFPGKSLPNPTVAMIEQGYDALRIFKQAEKTFVAMNMSAMPKLFWQNSILKKPSGLKINCHPNAWDFMDGKDFRIKMCTQINFSSLLDAYHEMGHIQYFLQVKDLPEIYRGITNPGFHEAIGDTVALSASTPAHLQKIKLLTNYTVDKEVSLNHLYRMALNKIVDIPFAYLVDLWRWDVFRGKITPDQYNCHWWKLAEKYQGIEPSFDIREDVFYPGYIFHIAADTDYLRYFVSDILQFQFHRALCIEAGEYDPKDPKSKPLHECDITDSKKAGNLLKSMMKIGSSKPWQDAMEVLTGERKMSSSGILDYFKPLMDWLTAENKKTNEYIGWKESSIRYATAPEKV